MGLRLPLVAAAVLVVAGCARPTWQSPLEQDHPLAGRVWDVAAARFIAPRTLEAALATRRYVLLGEKHDNPDHHALQARLLHALVEAGRRPAVAFEMLSTDRSEAIARQLAADPKNVDGLAEAVDWKQSGWPDWSQYRPIAQVALDAGLPVLAANIPTATARRLARGDASALDPALAAAYALDRPPPAEMLAAMTAELRAAHCGHTPQRVDGMVAAQRARDAQMAAALLGAATDGAVLIAGTGHVRRDRGVPVYLRTRRPEASVAVVAFLEVRRERTAPEQYAAAWDDTLPFDYVWFTPRVDDRDPCEAFRARPLGAPNRGAPRLRRGAPERWGLGGHVVAPM